jgi:hypothetical protein
MKPTSMHAPFVLAAIVAALSPLSTASAQYRLPTVVTVATADSLHTAAVALSRSMARWGDAARLHRQSASLRGPDDSLAFRCLSEAAQLSYMANDLSSARTSAAEAGAQALARGDVVTAANAYADAAWIAQEQRRKGDVWTFGRQAEVLAGSPLISREQRAAILKRFTHSYDAFADVAER